MIEKLFLSFIEISFSTGLVIIILILLSSLLNNRYALKWKYLLWAVLAIRLIVPFNINPTFRQFNIHIPNFTVVDLSEDIQTTKNLSLPIELQLQTNHQGISLINILLLIWFIGTVIFLLIHLCVYWNFRRQVLKQSNQINDKAILLQLNKISTELGLNKQVLILTCSKVFSPMMLGFIHPILVLPTEVYSSEELAFILKHELIHQKRHDVYYKLLLLFANSLHWFNPAIYFMVKEANIDLELSCDEEVIKGASYTERKLYTETILSTIHKQYNKQTMLSTQFYGGSKIMKQRFAYILGKQHKKNGLTMIMATLILTMTLGAFVACTSPNKLTAKTNENNTVDNSTTLTPKEIGDAEVEIPGETNETQNNENAEVSTSETLSADAEEIKGIVEEFSNAYFIGDKEAMKTLLVEDYDRDIDVYSAELDATGVLDASVKGLFDIKEKNIDDACEVWLEFRGTAKEDSYQYLTIELVKKSDGWKIQFYGLER